MIRVGIPPIGGDDWPGGFNYLVNLAAAIDRYGTGGVQPIVFLGTDVRDADAARFDTLSRVKVVRDPCFDGVRKGARLRQALLSGRDRDAAEAFADQDVQVAFAPATFYGWRFRMPTIAWMPDFQHRHLPHLFPRSARWRRDIGFRVQVATSSAIMLSSEDARSDCELFYRASRQRTRVVRFAVPMPEEQDRAQLDAIRQLYALPEDFIFLPNQFWRHKNHELVIDALAMLKAEGKDVVVAASGREADPRSPGHFPALIAKIRDQGLERNFRTLGMIPFGHVQALMQSCTALLNPSRFEGWSTTVEEAKALGTPLLLSSIDVHREQAGPETCYFSADSAVELAQRLADLKPRPHIPREMLAKAADLRMHAFANDFEALVSDVAGSGGTRGR